MRRARSEIAVGRMIEADNLVALHALEENIISRVVRRIAGFKAHAIRNAPAAQMLASPGIGKICCRKVDTAIGLLDHQATDAAIGELDGQGKSHWAGTGDQNGNSRR